MGVVPWLALLALGARCLFLSAPAWAEDQRVIGHIKTSVGGVTLQRPHIAIPVPPGALLREGDTLVTGDAPSGTTVTMIDGTGLVLGPRTRLVLRRFTWNPTTQAGQMRAELGVGTLAVQSGELGKQQSGNSLAIVTPRASVRVTEARVGLRVVEK